MHRHLANLTHLLKKVLLAKSVFFLQLPVATWIKLGRVQYFSFAAVLVALEDGVENALTDEEKADDFFGICVVNSVNFQT